MTSNSRAKTTLPLVGYFSPSRLSKSDLQAGFAGDGAVISARRRKGPDGPGRGRLMRMDMAKGLLTVQGLSTTDLAGLLSRQLNSTVLDKTALAGRYDYTLHWMPDESQLAMFKGLPSGQHEVDSTSAPESSGSSLFNALQEQLGLELRPQMGPEQILVIDHVETPPEN